MMSDYNGEKTKGSLDAADSQIAGHQRAAAAMIISMETIDGGSSQPQQNILRDRRFRPGRSVQMSKEKRERKRQINRLSAQRKRQRERIQLMT